MIPKVIHYCWFGGKPLPRLANKCIASWVKFFPDYEVIEWNEHNYNVNKIAYTKQAYETGKYAFVSDYARFDILYHHGGIYFDTDVEVIKPFNDILMRGAFMDCEVDGTDLKTLKHSNNTISINPGLGIAATPGLDIYNKVLEYYSNQHFIFEDGSQNLETVVTKVTKILLEQGLNDRKGIQNVGEITIYPKEFFNPKNNNTGVIEITENTHSIHWYAMTWLSSLDRIRSRITQPVHRLFGEDAFDMLKRRS